MIELIGQARLFSLGLDSENVDTTDERVIEWMAYMERKNQPIRTDPKRKVSLPREHTARLIKWVGDPLGGKLIELCERGEVQPIARNNSVLIHGYETKVTTEDEASLRGVVDEVGDLLERVAPVRFDEARFGFDC